MNPGKHFESQFRKSVPKHCLLIRLNDPPQSFGKSEGVRFSPKNPCDFLLFNTVDKILFPIELKTTKSKSISFEDINSDKKQSAMIHKHQIEALTGFSKYDNVLSLFLFNFRTEPDDGEIIERTYCQEITDFNNMCKTINKKSFNEVDLMLNNAIKVNSEKKRKNYIWDVEYMLNQIVIYKGVKKV